MRSHNELRDTFNTVEAILAEARFQKFLRWLHKQQESIRARRVQVREILAGRVCRKAKPQWPFGRTGGDQPL